MRMYILLVLLITFSFAGAQSFPENFTGNWEGELQWFQPGKTEPRKVRMQLNISPADTAGQFHWQLVYGKGAEDSRPYLLKPADSAAGHWRIDERNGIVLDLFWTGERFSGSFTVGQSTIVSSYRIEEDRMVVEFWNFSARPTARSGAGTEASPSVDSYTLRSFQKAVLVKKKT